jgi:hypothetical protein
MILAPHVHSLGTLVIGNNKQQILVNNDDDKYQLLVPVKATHCFFVFDYVFYFGFLSLFIQQSSSGDGDEERRRHVELFVSMTDLSLPFCMTTVCDNRYVFYYCIPSNNFPIFLLFFIHQFYR